MKNTNGLLLIIACLMIGLGQYFRRYTGYLMLGEILSIIALFVAIISVLLKHSKLKRSYLIIMCFLGLLFLLYPVFFNK